MAIVKTVFTATTIAANEPEVLAFLQANAAGYFDSFTDADGVISCMVGSVAALALSFNNTDKTTISLTNGTTATVYMASNNERFIAGYKTDYGVLLEGSTGATYMITKSNANSTAIVACLKNLNNAYSVFVGDVSNNSAWYTPNTGNTVLLSRQKYTINYAASLTTLTPLPLGDGGTYAPNLLVSCFTENGAITSVKRLVVNDVEYVYDGAFALRA